MPTKHDPPHAMEGELTVSGKKAKRSSTPKRSRHIPVDRLRVVADMMAGAMDYYAIQVTLSERWNVSMRTIRYYHQRVLTDMKEELEAAGYMDPGLEQVLGVRRLEEIYLQSMAAKDFRTAHQAVKTRMMVAGVLGPERILHQHQGAVSITATVQTASEAADAARKELARRLAGILAKPGTVTVLPAPRKEQP